MIERVGFDGLGVAAVVAAALRTGMLAALVEGSTTAAELAIRLGLDARATGLVLDVLAGEGLVSHDGEQVQAGPALLQLAGQPGGYSLSLGLWTHAETFLRTGEPYVLMDRAPQQREEIYRSVVSGLAKLFEGPARELAAALPVQPERILDVGCGSGVWSLALLQQHGQARATGLDLPAVADNFVARAEALGLADRVDTLRGDMHEVALPSAAYDLVVIANVLRLETPERAAALIGRLAPAVAPSGCLLVVDALAGGTPDRERARALYAMHLGLRTRQGQVHRPEAIAGWLAAAGLPQCQTVDVASGAGGLGGLLARRS